MKRKYFNIRSESEENNNQTDGSVLTKVKPKTKKPSLYKVLMLNDDYTPMEFVIEVLEKFFGKRQDEAHKLCFMFIKKVLVFVVFTHMKCRN